mmetsp:Transcript_15291/g.23450  ORF Transcript_15291/g.23450 Transcript_15291/m.23450 type:complete len:152 (-) Transcript_15291:197-652(-)
MMKFLVQLLILLIAVATTNAFTAVKPPLSGIIARSSAVVADPTTTTTALNVFGTRKSKTPTPEEEKYWQGEWVCKDCGYIYQRSECAGMYFEEQGVGFRCPQCSGPRRRYAKKVGDKVGTTLDGGDGPILLFSIGGMIATVFFGIWAVDNL